MKNLGESVPSALLEKNKTGIKIEHLPQIDVILNLNYPKSEDQNIILGILKENSEEELEELSLSQRLKKIEALIDTNGKQRFFVKQKLNLANQIDFLKGRTTKDPLGERAQINFGNNSKTRYALAGVLPEISLSRKILALINSSPFQELAQKYGFTDLLFKEPIVGLIEKKSKNKYLIYQNINGTRIALLSRIFSSRMLITLADELNQLFKNNGMAANDLRWEQFMVVAEGDQKHLVLIDTEAYTEEGSS